MMKDDIAAFEITLKRHFEQCSISSSIKYSGNDKEVGILCFAHKSEVKDMDVQDATLYLESEIINPMLERLKRPSKKENFSIVLEFAFHSQLSICYKIEPDGSLLDPWYSDFRNCR